MALAYIAEFGVALLLGATAVWALAWAVRTGQFADFGQGAASIFDDEEPVGRVTDTALSPASNDAGGSACRP